MKPEPQSIFVDVEHLQVMSHWLSHSFLRAMIFQRLGGMFEAFALAPELKASTWK